MSEVWNAILRVQETTDEKQLQKEAALLLKAMKSAWGNSHSAMEHLECIAQVFPEAQAHDLVRRIVLHWKKQPTYAWSAGGAAGHCYLSALVLTDNADLAEPELIEEWRRNSISKARHSLPPRTRDAAAKRANALDALA